MKTSDKKTDDKTLRSCGKLEISDRIFSFLVTFVTIMFSLIAAVFLIMRLIGLSPYIVQSGSMEPEISTGAVAFINTRQTNPEVGDIITYSLESGGSSGAAFVTHRVYAVEDGLYVTKGDANDAPDAKSVKPEQIIGTYKFQIPGVGFIMAKIKTKLIVIIIIWIVFLNVLSALFSSFVRHKRSSAQKTETNS